MTITNSAFIGRDSETGDRYYVTVRLESRQLTHDVQTIEHDTLPAGSEFVRLSITGDIVAKDRREPFSCGQIQGSIATVLESSDFVDGWSRADIESLVSIWDAWHLNDVKAACAHMDFAGIEGHDYDSRKNVPCAAGSGYRYGSAWLACPLPADVTEEVRRLTERLPRGTVPAYVGYSVG